MLTERWTDNESLKWLAVKFWPETQFARHCLKPFPKDIGQRQKKPNRQ
jgi:hypothetical protein